MGTDYAEKEREFVESLAEDTGRDLDQWMHAIAAAGHGKRNDIIDWLRQQGFAFPKASWLERIHHNGGRLIYAGDAANVPPVRRLRATPSKSPANVSPDNAVLPSQNAGPGVLDCPSEKSEAHMGPGPVFTSAAQDDDVALFLVAAKGLKPLADFILREVEAAVPGINYAVATPYLTIAAPAVFAALHAAPKELRLFADFGAGAGNRVRKAEASAARGIPPFPEVLVLNDARQIDGAFRELVASAYTRALK